MFEHKELRERILVLLQDDEARGQMAKILANFAIMLQVIDRCHMTCPNYDYNSPTDSSEKVDTDKLEELQMETIGLILKFFPKTEFSQYVHEFLWHSAQCISE